MAAVGKIPHLANLLVIYRPNFSQKEVPEALTQLIQQKNTDSELLSSPSGMALLFHAGDYEISSSQIRKTLKQDLAFKNQLPEEVYEYIKKMKLYI